ncbi:DedA family protein [Corynebacterium otitidis]|uniref:VTT domain-containing protein n=1 Tax=Corynebacterium otitidis ATCC 51513 TaxID=883169 RepID=K0Z389_9CORY|nr:DedA family protein [Corynebacterium otitidis]EJZ81830.1 hypothetical protein HMPREF9719_01251 [Corynebacterium otitidis ATCC 51513]
MAEQLVGLFEAILGSFWAYPIIALCVIGDAIMPVLPAESVITLASSWSASRGTPDFWAVFAVACVAAVVGDNTCFFLGRRLVRVLHSAPLGSKRAQALLWVETTTRKRPVFAIIVARFVPWGRWVLTIVLGAGGFSWLRFLLIDAIGVLVWASLAAGIGYAGGTIFDEQPLLGVIVGITVGSLVGLGIDHLQRRFLDHREVRSARSTA